MIKNRVIPILWGHRHRELQYTAGVLPDSSQMSNWLQAGHQSAALTASVVFLQAPLKWMKYLSSYFPDLENISYSFNRFSPGTYFPMHIDRYGFYSNQNKLTDLGCIRRYILFLEDAMPGHFLQIGDRIYHDWPAGLCVGWQTDEPHMAANLGLCHRYTLQITGMFKSNQRG